MQDFQTFCQRPINDLHHGVEVVQCHVQESLGSVLDKMVKMNIGSVIVVEGKKPVGIFTERDLLRKLSQDLEKHRSNPISQYMTKSPVCVPLGTPLKKVMSAMRLGKFRHLILTNQNAEIVGVISIKDVMDLIVDFFNS